MSCVDCTVWFKASSILVLHFDKEHNYSFADQAYSSRSQNTARLSNSNNLQSLHMLIVLDTYNNVLHLLNFPQVFSHVLPPHPLPQCARIPQKQFQYLLHFVTFTTRKKLFILFDVYFYHLLIPCLNYVNNPTTPHEPVLPILIWVQKTHFNLVSFLQFFSGQFTSFMYSSPSHFPMNSSFTRSPSAFNLIWLSAFALSK